MVRRRTIILVLFVALLLVTGSLCVVGKARFGCGGRGGGIQPLGQQFVREVTSASDNGNSVAISPQRGGEKESYMEILSCKPSETRLRFHLGEVSIQTANSGNSDYSIVRASGCAVASRAGEPELPVFIFNAAVADGAECIVEDCEWEEIEAPPPMPSAGAYWRSFGFEGERVANPQIYSGGQFPVETAAIQSTYRIRDVAGASVLLRPVCYDFSRGVLRIARSMDVCVRDNQPETSVSLDSNASFANIQSHLFVNASVLSKASDAGNPIGTLLMVLPDAWAGAEQDFISWKRRVGFDVKVRLYPSDTGDGNDALADYIRDEYLSSGTTHILLCGDCDDVPPAYSCQSPSSPGILEPTSDTRYAFLSGDDCVADAFISRVPSHSREQLAAVLSKITAYESNPPEDDSWRSKPLIMCSTERSSSGIYRNYSDYELLKKEYNGLVDSGVFVMDDARLLCDASAIAENVLPIMNGEGTSLFTYLGHGKYNKFIISNKTRFSASDAISLQNGSRLPFVLAPVCDSGNFACPNGDSLSEAFFLNGTYSENGAVAVAAATSNTLWNPPIKCISHFSELLKKAYSDERCLSVGELFQRSIIAGMQLADSEGSSLVAHPGEYFSCQMHLFGDCSMMPRLRTLRQVAVDVSANDKETLTVKVHYTDDDAPAKGAYVSLTSGLHEVTERAICDESGEATLSTSRFLGSATLMVNDASFRPYTEIVKLSCRNELDNNGDGFIANSELLAFIEHAKECADCSGKVDYAIEMWRHFGIEPVEMEDGTPTGTVCEAEGSGGEFSYKSILSEMDSLATLHSGSCRVEYIGQTRRGREIRGLCICAADEKDVPHLLFAAGTGREEFNSPAIALHLARFLLEDRKLSANAAIHIVPLLNPDEWEGDDATEPYAASRERKAFLRWAAINGFTAAVILASGKGTVCSPSCIISEASNDYIELSALCKPWTENSELCPNGLDNAPCSSSAESLDNAGILAIDVSVGLYNFLEGKKLQSLCMACEKPFASWCRTAMTGIAVTLDEGFPLSDSEVPCRVAVDGRAVGVSEGNSEKMVWLSKNRKWFRTLASGSHEIVASAGNTYDNHIQFDVNDNITALKVNLSPVDDSPLQGVAVSPRRFIPGGTNVFTAEYSYPSGGALIWNISLLEGWGVQGESSYATRIEPDGSVSLLYLEAGERGRLQCRVRAANAMPIGDAVIVSSILWAGGSSEVRRVLQPQAQRTVAISVESGWNLIGSTMTADVPKGLKAWCYDGHFRQCDTLSPGCAFWIHTDKSCSFDITGWESDNYNNDAKLGWNLLSPLRHLKANGGCLEYSSESRSFKRIDGVLKPGKAYWMFGN